MNKRYLLEFNTTGECKVDTDKLIKDWKINWNISQYGEEQYRVIDGKSKITISKKDAEKIIKSVPLFGKKSTLFTSATTWITESFKLSEIERLTALSNKLYYELKELDNAKPISI